MKCTKCEHTNPEDSLFCENCSAPIERVLPKSETSPMSSSQQGRPGIIRGKDGILRWAYELNMWKNPTLIITIWKVLLLAALVPTLLVFFLSLGGGIGNALIASAKIMVIVVTIVTGLMLLAYVFVGMLYRGNYCVVFEMDDKSVKHIQMQKQFKKSQLLSMITVLAGLGTGNIQTTAAGMLAGTKQSSTSNFAKVKTIVVHEKRHVIYVNENFTRNQVYADAAEFGFVTDHIISHCKNSKVTCK